MALSVITQPADYQPIHTPIMLEVSSNNTNQIDFKYKVTIAITGFALSRTLFVSPRPVDSRLELDIATHLRDYLDYDGFTLPFATNFTQAPYVQYTISIVENWEGEDQASTVSLAAKTASNVLIDRQEWLQNKATNFDFFHIKENGTIVGTPPKLLINKPLGVPMYKDELYYIHVVGKTDNDYMAIRVNQYDAAGNFVFPFSVNAASIATLNTDAVFAKLDLSTMTFNPLTTRIQVTILDGLNNDVTESKFFDLEEYECTPWERWKLFYMDKEGSYNNVSLDMISSSDFEVTSKTFRRRINPLTDTSRQRGVTRYTQKTAKKYVLNTNYLNDVRSQMIEDLIQSPRVYRDVRNVDGWGASDFLPVEILTAKIKPYAYGANDMPQYAIEARYSFENNARHE